MLLVTPRPSCLPAAVSLIAVSVGILCHGPVEALLRSPACGSKTRYAASVGCLVCCTAWLCVLLSSLCKPCLCIPLHRSAAEHRAFVRICVSPCIHYSPTSKRHSSSFPVSARLIPSVLSKLHFITAMTPEFVYAGAKTEAILQGEIDYLFKELESLKSCYKLQEISMKVCSVLSDP